ncbi:MAG: hypothetical protein WCK09_00275 [Bacteroidota bacterium]
MEKEQVKLRIHGVVSDVMIKFHLSNKHLHAQEIPRNLVVEHMQWVRDTIIRVLDKIEDPDDVNSERPPIGIMPRNVFEYMIKDQRFAELSNTISRFLSFGRLIPIAWLTEYNELIEYLRLHKLSEHENPDPK